MRPICFMTAFSVIDVRDPEVEGLDRLLVLARRDVRRADVDARRSRSSWSPWRAARADPPTAPASGSCARTLGSGLPLHVDAPVGVELEDLGAIAQVHGHAAAARDEADDVVAGKRTAAAGEAHQHVGLAADADADSRGGPRAAARTAAASALRARRPARRAPRPAAGARRPRAGDAPVADRGEEIVDRAAVPPCAPPCSSASPSSSCLAARTRPCAARARRMSRPSSTLRAFSVARIAWRIRLRALPVTTKSSQSLRGYWCGLVMISTVSPSASRERRGTILPFTLAPAQCAPTSLWIA